jgi:hypothetical protein
MQKWAKMGTDLFLKMGTDLFLAFLVSLSDPDALSGMTAEERASVLNFNVP